MKNTTNQLDILVIEDNPADLFLIGEMLRSSNAGIRNIYNASRISDAHEILAQHEISIVLLDLSLPDSFGMDSFLSIKPATQNIPVIILTGLSESAVALEVLKEGAQDYLIKGEFKTDLLIRSIQYSIERKNAERKILLSEEKYRQMFYKNPFPALIYDLDSLQILEANDAALQKYGYTKEEFLNLNITDIRLKEDITDQNGNTDIGRPNNEDKGRLWLHRRKNGQPMIVEITYYQIDYAGKVAMQAQINDVTEKIRLEKELHQEQKMKARQLTEAILGAQEEERKLIGAELHDNINQILASSKLYFNAALDNPVNTRDMIAKGSDYIGMAIEEIRKLSKALVAPPFIEYGLGQSIEGLASDIMAVKPITINTMIEKFDETRVGKDMKVAIYRIIQEQLNNILKYAEASEVNINIQLANEKLLLSVEDNGKGFDTQAHRNGIGLTNMQNRAELFNGNLTVRSSPGKGCRVAMELQINKTEISKAA